MHTVKVIQSQRMDEPATGRDVVRIWTDAPGMANSVFVPYVEGMEQPKGGDPLSWDQRHVYWSGQVLHKVGYAFDEMDRAHNQGA